MASMLEMDPDLISRRDIAEKKRPRAGDAAPRVKKLRSKIPRRKRVPCFPMVGVTLGSYFRSEDEAESSSSCFNNEISNSVSAKFTGHGQKLPRSSSDLRLNKPIRSFHTDSSGDHFQPITKFYSKRKKESRSKELMVGMKEFMVGAGDLVTFSESAALTKGSEPAESDGTAIAISGVSEISATLPRDSLKTGKNSSESKLKVPELSESSCLLPPGASEPNDLILIQDNSTAEVSRIEFKSETTKRSEKAHDHDLESDLACPEQLFDDDGSSDYSNCIDTTLSDFESDLFDGIYDGGSSEVSLSDLIESPDDFSERSRDNYTPSAAFSLLHQLYEQFHPYCNHSGINPKFEFIDELSEHFVFVRFPDIDDEESYQNFRSRERSEVALHDYCYGHHNTTKYGDLIVGQRLEMVNWMMEHCEGREDHDETIFLGVNLMDRFLSRGYFETTRNLQLLGIACATLAARIEENQPFNNVRKKYFKVGKNSYKRCEVVSMEWLVLEVLNFQCSLPTTHSFLWFYMKAARAGPDVQELCRHLAILTLFNHGILRFWPSTVAAGVVILACLVTNNASFCDVVLEIHCRSKTDDLPECIQSLEWLVEYAKLRSGNGS